MPVYVDDMYKYPMGRFGRMKMSHMVADTREELLAMATIIGVPHKWVQYPECGRDRCHFDISITKRKAAIQAGAIPMTLQGLALMCQCWRIIDNEGK